MNNVFRYIGIGFLSIFSMHGNAAIGLRPIELEASRIENSMRSISVIKIEHVNILKDFINENPRLEDIIKGYLLGNEKHQCLEESKQTSISGVLKFLLDFIKETYSQKVITLIVEEI